MYFTEIELHNFGIYRGTHRMCLRDGQDGRNITLIGGLNGRGKTTFLDAVILTLYGRQALKYIQENARSYDKLLLDRMNRQAQDGETYTAVSLCLEDGTMLRVCRSWTLAGRKIEESLTVEKGGTEDHYLGENWSYYIEEILPFGIARFFFFNNEKITQLADDASFEQMKSSIRSAIGVSVIDRTIDHVRTIIRKKKQTLNSQEEHKDSDLVADLDQKIVQTQTALKEAEQAITEHGNEVARLAEELEQKQTQFWSSGGELSLQRDSIRRDMDRLEEQIHQDEEQITQLVADPGTPLFLTRDLLRQVRAQELTHQQNLARLQSRKVLQGMLDHLLSRLQDCDLDPITCTNVVGIITSVVQEYIPEVDPAAYSSSFSAASLKLCDTLQEQTFVHLVPEILRITESLQKQNEERERLGSHLENASGKENAQQLFQEICALEKQKGLEEAAFQQEQEKAASLHSQLDGLNGRLIQEIKAIAARRSSTEDDHRIVRYAAMGIEVLESFRSRMQQEKLQKLSDAVTRCFQNLSEKNSLVSRIEIDPETLDVTLYDGAGAELLKSQLSAGEQQMFAVSVVWALALTSGYRAPVIIDTPMARLDSSHRANFVSRYLPSASSQVLVLSTDEEVYGTYYNLITEHIDAAYTLLYREEQQCTSIVPGYFESGGTAS